MAGRLGNSHRSNYGRGGLVQSTYADKIKDHSAPPQGDELSTGQLLLKLDAAKIQSSGGPAQLSNFHSIASYNWLNDSEPTILVPGSSSSTHKSNSVREYLLISKYMKGLLQSGHLRLTVGSSKQTRAKYSSIKMLRFIIPSPWSQCSVPFT